MPRILVSAAATLLLVVAMVGAGPAGSASGSVLGSALGSGALSGSRPVLTRGSDRHADATAPVLGGRPSATAWAWPVPGAAVTRPFTAPATRYAAGHRGVDVGAAAGSAVLSPADGVVVFAGRVVDRGVVTLDVGGGVVVTLEPVATVLHPGDVVARGGALGIIDTGGHAAAGALHLGVRVDGEYVDPMRFFGGTPRAILLPCC